MRSATGGDRAVLLGRVVQLEPRAGGARLRQQRARRRRVVRRAGRAPARSRRPRGSPAGSRPPPRRRARPARARRGRWRARARAARAGPPSGSVSPSRARTAQAQEDHAQARPAGGPPARATTAAPPGHRPAGPSRGAPGPRAARRRAAPRRAPRGTAGARRRAVPASADRTPPARRRLRATTTPRGHEPVPQGSPPQSSHRNDVANAGEATGRCGRHHQRARVRRLDRAHDVALDRRARVGIVERALQRRRHERRVQHAPVVQRHALAQPEDPGVVVGRLPGLREPGDEPQVAFLLDQAVVDVRQDRERVLLVLRVRIEALQARGDGDDHRALPVPRLPQATAGSSSNAGQHRTAPFYACGL